MVKVNDLSFDNHCKGDRIIDSIKLLEGNIFLKVAANINARTAHIKRYHKAILNNQDGTVRVTHRGDSKPTNNQEVRL